MGSFGDLLKTGAKVGATAAGTAIGGPAGGALAGGLANFGTSVASGNSLGESLVSGATGAATGALNPMPEKTAGVAPPTSDYNLGNWASQLTVPSVSPQPTLLDILNSRRNRPSLFNGW